MQPKLSIRSLSVLMTLLVPISTGLGQSNPQELEQGQPQQQQKKSDSQNTLGGEQSVKPGINKAFKDPDLSVDTWIERFEIESREIYLQRAAIVKACGIKTGDTVADVGAGTGLFTRMFSESVGNNGWVFAVDISPAMISHITTSATKNKLGNITGVVCAENSINLPPNSVDVVFICDTYHHFEYPKSTLTSIARALKFGGKMIVIDFERIQGKSREWTLGHVRAGKEVFRAEIQDAGFNFINENEVPQSW